MNRWVSGRLAGALIIGIGILGLGAPSVFAQCTSWNVLSGNWNTSGNWSAGIPNSGTNACLTNGTSGSPATTTLDVTGATANLTVGGSNTLNMGTNTLSVFGASISNAGNISTANGILNIANSVTLSGGGTLMLSSGAWVQENSGSLTLTNQDNLIEGDGQLGHNGLSLNNQASGTVSANDGGTLLLNGGGSVTNAGLLTATSGVLQIINNVNNTGGNITANGSAGIVEINGATITGGTLNTVNSGVITANSTSTLSGVTISANSNVSNGGQQINLVGTITNNGTLTSPDGNFTVTGGDVTLTGGGVVNMQSNTLFNEASGSLTLHNVNNTIQGTGQLGQNGLSVDNQSSGVINATGNALSLNGGGTVANAGLLTATGAGVLTIIDNVNNTATGNITGNGGTVQLNGTTITGGTLNTINGGVVTATATSTLSGVTINVNSNVSNGGQQINLVGTITNNGTLTSPDGNFTVTGGDVTLTGGGVVNMQSNTLFNEASGSLTLHNVNNTIQGTGQLGENGLTLDNQTNGVINASGGTLTLNGGGTVTNAGLLEATAGGTLQISNTVNNSSNITGNGGSVLISSLINGGTLNAINGGSIGTSGTATLNGVTISSGTNYNTGTGTTNLVGTITNHGTLTSPNGFIQVQGGDVSLQGGGNVVLQTDAFIQQASGSLTLHNVDNTISGAGQIGVNGLTLDNQTNGVINASGGTLTLNGGTSTNAGLLEATTGGTLQISNTVNNSSNITGNGGSVLISSLINGGTLNAINGGSIGTSGTATLNGVTISAGTNYNTGTGTTNLVGTITNHGTLTSPNGFIQVQGGDVILQGGGNVVLQTDAFIQQASGSLTLHNVDNTISGAGQIGVDGLTLDNQTNGVINASGGTLILNGGTSTNAGLLEATTGGTLQISNAVNNSANITGNGGSVLISSLINGGTLNAINGGSIGTSGTATLNGVTISAGTNYNAGTVTNLEGIITNKGTITQNNEVLQVMSGDVTLTGGGTVVLQASPDFQEASGSLTLHNVNNTIQGTGSLGANGLTIDNQSGGKILANVNGGTLSVNGGGLLTNSGTLKASNGGALIVSSPISSADFSAGILKGGGTYAVNGTSGASTLQINSFGTSGGEINTLAAGTTITLAGANTNVRFVDASGLNALTNLTTNAGNLNLEGGYNFISLGQFNNSGDVVIDSASSLSTAVANYVQTGGETQVDGTLTAALVDIQGGTLAGGDGSTPGQINGNVQNGGTVQAGDNLNVPVDPQGDLNILGNYTQLDGATLAVDIAGISPGDTSEVNVTGDVNLAADSNLTIDLLNSFEPRTSEDFLFLKYTGNLNADDFVLTDANVDPFGTFTVDYTTPNQVSLDFTATASTPEPSAYLLLGVMLAALGAYLKVRKNRVQSADRAV